MEQEEIGIFIKAGSIIPRKYMRRLSALNAIDDNYLLDIYPRADNGQANGFLYLDDGETFNHKNLKEYTLVEFIYDNGKLFIKVHHLGYTQGQSFIVDELNIFNVANQPAGIKMKKGQNKGFNSKHNENEKHLEITDLRIHIIEEAGS